MGDTGVHKVISKPSVQFLLMYCAPVLAAWGAFHLGEWYETAKMIRSAPHDAQAGMDVLAGGIVWTVAAFFLTMLLMYLLIRRFGESSD
jgi:Na+/proline symporter